MQPIENDLALAHALADAAADAIRPHFRTLTSVDNKQASGFDPVTVADRAAEFAIRAVLAEHRPDDGILGEEFDDKPAKNGRTWVLDPIDGTRAFICGLHSWGTLIALIDETGPRVGLMAQPIVGERFYAARGGPAEVRTPSGTLPLKTRPCAALSDAIVACTGFSHLDAPLVARLAELEPKVRLIRLGTDCYGHALLAAGHIDVVVEAGLKPFDVAPFPTMIEMAGGRVFDRRGADIGPHLLTDYNGDGMAVGDPRLMDALVAAIG
ncbi:MAG: inositol monophosphatase family protein [Pseudomonadota bacterium]